MIDFKIQQYRWTKGRGQVIKKHLGNLVKAKLPLLVKIHAIFDLLNVFIHVGILLIALFSVPLIFLLRVNPDLGTFFMYQSLALINIVIAPWFAWIVFDKYASNAKEKLIEMRKTFLPFLVILVAFPLFMVISLIDGFFSKKSFFHRTSKYNAKEGDLSWRNKIYSPSEIPLSSWFEGVLAIYFLLALFVDFRILSIAFIPFHTLLTLGFSSLFMQSVRKA